MSNNIHNIHFRIEFGCNVNESHTYERIRLDKSTSVVQTIYDAYIDTKLYVCDDLPITDNRETHI